jgi:hypothetical protein
LKSDFLFVRGRRGVQAVNSVMRTERGLFILPG